MVVQSRAFTDSAQAVMKEIGYHNNFADRV